MAQATHFPIAVMLTVRDVKKSVAFYRDTLGFALEKAWPDKENPMWADMLLDGQSIMLGGTGSDEEITKMCGNDKAALELMLTHAREFRANKPGAGVFVYVRVPDVDAQYARVAAKGAAVERAPHTEFYGQREVTLRDPDGYTLVFYAPVMVSECQSCGMPLADAKPGQLYCHYCTDERGKLRPYEQIFEGTVTGYFMGMQKMTRPDAEKAAREHLKRMPAWAGRP